MLAAAAVGIAAGGCSGGDSGPTRNEAGYLLIVKSPTDIGLANASDTALLGYGDHACRDFDAGQNSDTVVNDLSGGALPGSQAYNSFAMVSAAAAKELCPQHESQFAGASALAGS